MSESAFLATPFHTASRGRNRTTWWYGWGGYVVPDVYTDPWSELQAIRTAVSMNEMSPLPKTRISGPDSPRFVDYLITRDASRMPVHSAWYTPWCNDEGRVISDGIVFRFGPEHFLFSGDRSLQFFRQKSAGFDVAIDDVTDEFGVLALQGPRARLVLEAVTAESWADLRFGRIREARIGGVSVQVARQGFTGELGYELWVARAGGSAVWEAVAAAGTTHGIRPAGEYAIDIARVEAGLILVSADYSGAGPDQKSADVVIEPEAHITPYELGVGHCVNLKKAGDFVGRQALIAEHHAGARRALVGLELNPETLMQLALEQGRAPEVTPRVRWDRLTVRDGDRIVGRATSITWSPTLRKVIGFACLERKFAVPGTQVRVDWKDFWGAPLGRVPARVVNHPFIELRRAE